MALLSFMIANLVIVNNWKTNCFEILKVPELRFHHVDVSPMPCLDTLLESWSIVFVAVTSYFITLVAYREI